MTTTILGRHKVASTHYECARPDAGLFLHDHLTVSSQFGRATPHTRNNVYDIITDRIIALLEQGTVPWHKPWKVQTGLPRNLVSRKPYRGINLFLLHAMQYESPFWLTFHQAELLGALIRKGEKACPVVFWKQLEVDDKSTGEKTKVPFLRLYHVFNTAQCDGLTEVPDPSSEAGPTSAPATIVEAMSNRPAIKYGMACAFYSPDEDYVGLPNPERFENAAERYSVLFHELIHSTGHHSRLNRQTLTAAAGFGTDEYCREELIAELGAAFLCGHAGIAERTLDNSTAYLSAWLGKLQSDRTLIIQAAAQAQKAADFILGTKFEHFDEVPAQSPEL